MLIPPGRPYMFFCVLTVNLLSFTAGLLLAWTSPVLPKLTNGLEDNPFGEKISDEEGSWVGSLLALGACFGPPISGILADKLGRKNTLCILAIPYIISLLTLAFAKSLVLYYIARFVAGLSVGSTFVITPMYIVECCEVSTRGRLSSVMNVYVTAGTLFSYAVGPYTSITWFGVICAIFPVVCCVTFFLVAPESPYFLIKTSSIKSAEMSLSKFRSCSDEDIKSELSDMRNEIKSSGEAKFIDIFKSRGTIKALIISLALMAFQQFSGINIILFYAQNIFDASGTDLAPEICSIIIGITQVLSSFTTPIFADKAGRKVLLLISAAGMLVFEATIGVYFYLDSNGSDVKAIFWIPVTCLVGYILTYNVAFGPIPWVVMAEIFPDNVKSVASAIGGTFCWLAGFILTKLFSTVADQIGMHGSFWFFSAFNAAAIIFVTLYVPETKGKTLSEILKILNS